MAIEQTERKVFCQKLGREAPGLAYPPLKGSLGQRVYEHISAEAWELWKGHSTMVINEFRLNPSEPDAQRVLEQELEKFLFSGQDSAPPPDFVPPEG